MNTIMETEVHIEMTVELVVNSTNEILPEAHVWYLKKIKQIKES